MFELKISKTKVRVLDHDGFMNADVPVTNGSFVLDGSKYKSMYYLIIRNWTKHSS